jgi:hypothetical protein
MLGRCRAHPPPIADDFLWEGIELAGPAEIAWAASAEEEAAARAATRIPTSRRAPRVIVTGRYMARPSIVRAAPMDWAFAMHATPIIVMTGEDGAELVRASLDRIRAERRAIVDGMSISYMMPPPFDHGPADDEHRREGAPIAIDLGLYIPVPAAPCVVRVHAEFGPLRSPTIEIRVLP